VTDYNGWTNWATWNVFVWLTNDEQVYRIARAFARCGNIPDLKWLAVHETHAVDLDGVCVPEVNWAEIVEGLKEE